MMPCGKKKFLWRHPRGYWYVRVKGRYHRITAKAGTPEFDRQYCEILSGKRAEDARSFRMLIESYRKSERRTSLKPRTQADYQRVLEYLNKRVGQYRADFLVRKDVIAAMKANEYRVRFANYIQQVLSVLFEHAIDLGWVQQNPAKGVRKLKTLASKRQVHVP